MSNTNRLGSDTIGKLLAVYAVPSVVSLVLNALYNMVDQIFIGRGVGYLANGATNVIFPLTQFAVAIGLLIGDGTASYMNLRLGAGDKESSDRGLVAGIVGLVLSGIVLFFIYNILLKPLCILFGATEGTLEYAIDYGRIISLGIIFCVFASGAMSIVRANGNPQLAMIGMVVGCIINIIGDPVAIFVLDWGVKGAAWATILGQAANALIYAIYLYRNKLSKLSTKIYKKCFSYIQRVSKLGISSFATQLSVVLVIAIQNNLLVYYGAMSKYGEDIPMTALGVTMKVFTVLQCAISGLMAGAQPILSYNYGSSRYDRVRRTLSITLIASVALMAIATIWFQLSPLSIIHIFGSENDLYNEFAVKCLRVFLSLLVFDAFQMVASSFLQSVGKPYSATLLVFLRQIIILIPAMLLLSRIYGVDGVLYAGPVAGFVVGIASIAMLIREMKRMHVSQ